MQKWEYQTTVIYAKKSGGGFLGPKETYTFGCDVDGVFINLDKYLLNMGQSGWELSSSAMSQQLYGGPSIGQWYYPEHLLYFKRPL
jgi:hypothetical protein